MVRKDWRLILSSATLGLLAVLSTGIPLTAAELDGREYAVELTANIATEPPEITLAWPGDGNARAYTISRKGRDENAWREIGRAEGPSTGFLDRDVQVGVGYEYQVIKESSLGITAFGYIYAGINLPLVEDRGKVIVLTTPLLAETLEPELLRLEFDLIGDGWSVERASVSPTNSPPEVKALIQSIYAKDPARTRSLLLFGHIPVAYSGNIMPDGHENHQGAWPADVYYADMDGVWTDETVLSTNAELKRIWNRPGDGRFDQSEPPSDLELQTGRVDLSNLTCFSNKTPSRSELDLARQYLDKNHRFRVGEFVVQQRALIFDRMESKTAEPISAMSWRNFAPFVGREITKIGDNEYFTKVSSGTYLWSAVTAGGSFVGADHVGTSDAFALYDVNAVFTTFLGSYYGDWDVESSFLRAALGARGTILTTAYSGQPQWLFHHMALGETIGFSAKITQQNDTNGIYVPHNIGAGEVHVALLGDPTLRAHPVPAVRNVRAEADGTGLIVGWQVPVINGLQGFYVYRASDPKGPYVRVTPNPITQAAFRLPDWKAGETVMVKAIALTRTPSGSYYNSSVGAFYPDRTAVSITQPPDPPSNLSIAKVHPGSITISWVGAAARTSGFRIERKDPGSNLFREIASTAGNSFTFEDRALTRPGIYTYRVRAFNAVGSSGYSNEALASTLAASAEFVGLDVTTQGNWIGGYGAEGFIIPAVQESLPSSFTMTTSNVLIYRTRFESDIRCPQLTDSESRSANCYVNGTPMAFHLNFSDEKVHQIAFYLAAWERREPWSEFEVLDAVSGESLDKRRFEDFDEGVYAIYNVKRQVYVRVTPSSYNTNTEIYGIFIDPAKVAPVRIEPAGGEFLGRTSVTLSTPTANGEIFYTLDGTEPTPQSARYSGPFRVDRNCTLRVRAFREGFLPSVISEGEFRNTLSTAAAFVRWDRGTHGSWPGVYGAEGVWQPNGGASFPSNVEMSIQGADPWTWSGQTTDERALLVDSSSGAREAKAWFATEAFDLHVNVFDNNLHLVSLYFLDYDEGSRVQEIEMIDSAGRRIERLALEGFRDGAYGTIAVRGSITARIRRVQGRNAVLSGVFVDPIQSPLFLAKPSPLTGVGLQNGVLSFAQTAFPGLRVCVDRSLDLVNWQCYATNEITSTSVQLIAPIDDFEPKTFFRTHFVP